MLTVIVVLLTVGRQDSDSDVIPTRNKVESKDEPLRSVRFENIGPARYGLHAPHFTTLPWSYS